MRLIPERPSIPSPRGDTSLAVSAAVGLLARVLVSLFGRIGFRLNRVLPKDGTEAMRAALPLQSVLAAALPAAADNEGAIIYVSDGAGGSRFRGSDGSSWVSLG